MHPVPKFLQCFPGPLLAARIQAIRHDHGIHGAGTGTADALNKDAVIFQKAVQDPPGEGPMGTTSLKGQFDYFRFCHHSSPFLGIRSQCGKGTKPTWAIFLSAPFILQGNIKKRLYN